MEHLDSKALRWWNSLLKQQKAEIAKKDFLTTVEDMTKNEIIMAYFPENYDTKS